MKARWFSLSGSIAVFLLPFICSGTTGTGELNLARQEKAWLDQHRVITLGIDNTYSPLNYVDEDGTLVGMSVDYINALAEQLGITVNYRGSICSIAIKKALDHEVDSIVNADETEKRKDFLNFTIPYATLPTGLVTLRTAPERDSITDLNGLKDIIICAKNNSSHLELIENKTTATVLPIETLEEGLKKVLKEEAFGVFDDVSVAGYLISKFNL